MELLEVVSQNSNLEFKNLSLCHLRKRDKTLQNKNREITEEWLQRKIDDLDLKFRYFITLSFWKGSNQASNNTLIIIT